MKTKKVKLVSSQTCGECGKLLRRGTVIDAPQPDPYGWTTECPRCGQTIHINVYVE